MQCEDKSRPFAKMKAKCEMTVTPKGYWYFAVPFGMALSTLACYAFHRYAQKNIKKEIINANRV